jgi:hypothetical protein
MNTGARQNIILTMCAFLSSGILSVQAQDAALGEFESHGDIGSPKLAGSAGYDPASQARGRTCGLPPTSSIFCGGK